ncbi:MAG: MOSC domain-containing protein [Spirochaetota bacterium]
MLRATIDAVCVGTVSVFGPNGEPSAIRKHAVSGPVRIEGEGPVGEGPAGEGPAGEAPVSDAHGDTVHHGGPEKAVHHYAFEHYRLWQTELPDACAHFERPPFFGENIFRA